MWVAQLGGSGISYITISTTLKKHGTNIAEHDVHGGDITMLQIQGIAKVTV